MTSGKKIITWPNLDQKWLNNMAPLGPNMLIHCSWTKWSTFCRRHFRMHNSIYNHRISIRISPKLVPISKCISLTYNHQTFIWISLNIFPIYIKSELDQMMIWCRTGDRPCLIQRWPKSWTPYDVTRPEWVHNRTETFNPPKLCKEHIFKNSVFK